MYELSLQVEEQFFILHYSLILITILIYFKNCYPLLSFFAVFLDIRSSSACTSLLAAAAEETPPGFADFAPVFLLSRLLKKLAKTVSDEPCAAATLGSV